jgi:hypothetical protein
MDFEFGCEECGTEKEHLLNTITNNKPTRLCSRCAMLNNSIVLEEERRKIQDKILEKRQPKESVAYKEPVVSLNDLWARYKTTKDAREEKKKQFAKEQNTVLDENKFVEDLEKQKLKEKQDIRSALEGDFDVAAEQQEIFEFNVESGKKVTLKDMFKSAFKRLKRKEKQEDMGEKQLELTGQIEEIEGDNDEN